MRKFHLPKRISVDEFDDNTKINKSTIFFDVTGCFMVGVGNLREGALPPDYMQSHPRQ
jgi:hypothetical protein